MPLQPGETVTVRGRVTKRTVLYFHVQTKQGVVEQRMKAPQVEVARFLALADGSVRRLP